MESYVKCSGCNCLRNEATEFEVYKGKRRLSCILCKGNRIKHNKNKNKCYKCYKVYDKTETHQMSRICYDCINKCEHGETIYCKDCKRKSKDKTNENRRNNKCCHNNRKSNCRLCNPRIKNYGRCEHNEYRYRCKVCNPKYYLIDLIRSQVRRCFNLSTLNKINHSIEYLGCDVDTLKKHIQDKMTVEMTVDNIHYDHIKPVSCFDLDDEEEFLKCCHFTNLQPLLAKDNLELNNTWTAENERFWNEHIIYKPDYKDLYKL